QTRCRTALAGRSRRRLRSPRPGAGGKRSARASSHPAAVGSCALREYIHPRAAQEEPQPARAGGSTGAAATSNSISGNETANSRIAERFASSVVFLGALVRRL